jgi:beta-glucosidase
MFRFHLIGTPPRGSPRDKVISKSDTEFALVAAEHSIVLLKNGAGILPISSSHSGTVAVIGTDSTSAAVSEGEGGAHVLGPFLVKPLTAIEHTIGQRHLAYAAGSPVTPHLPLIPRSFFRSGSPLPSITVAVHHRVRAGQSDLGIIHSKGVTEQIATADFPRSSGSAWTTWKATIVPTKTGLYELSLGENGDTWFSINGRDVMAFRGLHGRVTWTTTVSFIKGHRYNFELDWFRTDRANPRLGWEYVTPFIDQAVTAARHAQTAIVFVSDFSSEGFDRPTLSLPGDANALIEAVAAVNRRTVVVLNTGGAVLMPWLNSVQAVLEAWYPGEEDGTATSAVLFGSVDPSARLPITFPSSDTEVATDLLRQWPGVNGTVDYSEGLDIGYRYLEAQHLHPLFAFGYGLSYTSFRLGTPSTSITQSRATISMRVTNTGRRPGTDVIECYLQFPSSAGEPPLQLRGFVDANLRPGRSKEVHLALARSAFEDFSDGHFVVPSGSFTAFVGSSSASFSAQVPIRPPTA